MARHEARLRRLTATVMGQHDTLWQARLARMTDQELMEALQLMTWTRSKMQPVNDGAESTLAGGEKPVPKWIQELPEEDLLRRVDHLAGLLGVR